MNDNKRPSRAGKNFNNVLDEWPDIEAKSRQNRRSAVVITSKCLNDLLVKI